MNLKWNVIEYKWDNSIVYEYDNTMKMMKMQMKWKCKWYEIELNRTWDDMNMSMIMNENEMIIWYGIELKWRWYECEWYKCEYGNWN